MAFCTTKQWDIRGILVNLFQVRGIKWRDQWQEAMTKLLACARHRACHGGGWKTIQGESAVPDTPQRETRKTPEKEVMGNQPGENGRWSLGMRRNEIHSGVFLSGYIVQVLSYKCGPSTHYGCLWRPCRTPRERTLWLMFWIPELNCDTLPSHCPSFHMPCFGYLGHRISYWFFDICPYPDPRFLWPRLCINPSTQLLWLKMLCFHSGYMA